MASALFITIGVAAGGAKIIGTGYLTGVTVEIDGDEVCTDPYYWSATNTLECE